GTQWTSRVARKRLVSDMRTAPASWPPAAAPPVAGLSAAEPSAAAPAVLLLQPGDAGGDVAVAGVVRLRRAVVLERRLEVVLLLRGLALGVRLLGGLDVAAQRADARLLVGKAVGPLGDDLLERGQRLLLPALQLEVAGVFVGVHRSAMARVEHQHVDLPALERRQLERLLQQRVRLLEPVGADQEPSPLDLPLRLHLFLHRRDAVVDAR